MSSESTLLKLFSLFSYSYGFLEIVNLFFSQIFKNTIQRLYLIKAEIQMQPLTRCIVSKEIFKVSSFVGNPVDLFDNTRGQTESNF